MVPEDGILYTNEEKLSYVFKQLKLSTKEIAKCLQISAGLVSQIQNPYNGKLKNIHLYAIAHAYHVPMEIFKEEITHTAQIDTLLKRSTFSPFYEDYQLLEKLLGQWYFYSYPSNPNLAKVWSTQTIIHEDFTVEDMHRNRGRLYIGKKQSIILKESNNSKNITCTVFDNNRITYGSFPFSRIAKSNNFNREILSFGFCSRKFFSKEQASRILGELSEVQLQLDYSLIERISSTIIMEG